MHGQQNIKIYLIVSSMALGKSRHVSFDTLKLFMNQRKPGVSGCEDYCLLGCDAV